MTSLLSLDTDRPITAREFLAAMATPVETREALTELDLWGRSGPPVWRATRFLGTPTFYPVYRCGDLYSHSPLPLIVHKGGLHINPRVAHRVARPSFLYLSGRDTIDRDIGRVGGPPRPTFEIKGALDYARQLAAALQADVATAEAAHPGYTNVVLCGGKDSLNLLLLPWRNPVVVASAPPNYDLVRTFVTDHALEFDVIRLDDDDASLLPVEILANCCRNNLEHCRWGPALRRLTLAFDGRVMIWKGQLANSMTTPGWRRWRHVPPALADGAAWGARVLGRLTRPRRHRLWAALTFPQRFVFWSQWHRGAMWQGSHMSMIRHLTGALVLSAYHGPATRRVLAEVDLGRAVRQDVRPIVGRYLYGGPVRYPATNPGPPVSSIRRGLSHLAPFLDALKQAGITARS